ncbi:macro domain-containing protein [Loigolactobacillus iwatensis]|uniref:macro domain-containing protein n=1 Tax=Loigolactobacillus iwatensis TaxID=1267156 RepID=UPI000F7DC474|nr:macro domain-containing protein [Loigolactobacillus iwatensis]
MLIYVKTNLFESPAQVLVNTVNTVGVMGKGIALKFKKMYPDMFKEYQRFCETGALSVGKLWLYKSNNKWVLNFPTKKNWRQKSRIEYIEAGLQKFVQTYEEKKIKSISFPQLGVGNGGLDWDSQVKPLMEKYLKKLPIDVYIHLYNQSNNSPEYKNVREMNKWLDAEPRSISIHEFKAELVDNFSSGTFQEEGHTVTFSEAALDDSYRDPAVPFLVIEKQNGESYSLSQADISEIWTRLRDKGLVSIMEFPQILHEHDDVIFFEHLVSSLPYIDIIQITWAGHDMTALSLNESMLLSNENTIEFNDHKAIIGEV